MDEVIQLFSNNSNLTQCRLIWYKLRYTFMSPIFTSKFLVFSYLVGKWMWHGRKGVKYIIFDVRQFSNGPKNNLINMISSTGFELTISELQVCDIFAYIKLQTNNPKSRQSFAKKSWFKSCKTFLTLLVKAARVTIRLYLTPKSTKLSTIFLHLESTLAKIFGGSLVP